LTFLIAGQAACLSAALAANNRTADDSDATPMFCNRAMTDVIGRLFIACTRMPDAMNGLNQAFDALFDARPTRVWTNGAISTGTYRLASSSRN
jgi:hypothetical protein